MCFNFKKKIKIDCKDLFWFLSFTVNAHWSVVIRFSVGKIISTFPWPSTDLSEHIHEKTPSAVVL